MKKKIAISIVAVALVLCCAIGGTLAWLTATSGSVTNTFTVGDIDIDLTETTTEYKVIPGSDIAKDPTVTVKAVSEACWLFVEIEEENWSTGLTYSVVTGTDGWTALPGETGVYYRQVPAVATGEVSFQVLAGKGEGVYANGFVHAADSLTRDDLQAMNTAKPKLTFTAYAVQSENVADAATAWTHRNG